MAQNVSAHQGIGTGGQGLSQSLVIRTDKPLLIEHVGKDYVSTSIQNTGLDSNVIVIIEVTILEYDVPGEVIEYGTLTTVFCLVLYKEKFFTVECVSDLFAHD